MHEEQVPAYIPEYKIAEEQTSLQEQRMKNLRLFAQKYAKQIATNQIPSVYLEHQESNSLQMGTPFNINSGVQKFSITGTAGATCGRRSGGATAPRNLAAE